METPTPRGFCGMGRRRAKSVARRRAPALLRRSTDVTASLFTSRLADCLACAQRRRFHMRRTSSQVPHYHGHRQRLRERFAAGGADALADYELLELLLFMAIPQRDIKPLAKMLIDHFGSFA